MLWLLIVVVVAVAVALRIELHSFCFDLWLARNTIKSQQRNEFIELDTCSPKLELVIAAEASEDQRSSADIGKYIAQLVVVALLHYLHNNFRWPEVFGQRVKVNFQRSYELSSMHHLGR